MDGNYLTEHGYIPWDKSWILRMGVMDIANGMEQIFHFLQENYEGLNDDLKSFYHAYTEWKDGKKEIHAGESATLYRFLQFLAWKQGLDKIFIPEGTLVNRVEEFFLNEPDMVNWSLEKLLIVEGGTTQRASAAILLGNTEIIDNPAPEIKMSYKAVSHWHLQRSMKKPWIPSYDGRILNQATAYHGLFFYKKAEFTPEQAEDYCFARTFGFMTKEEGERLWPKLKSHESSRIEEMEKVLEADDKGEIIDSKDHRVVQAIAMRQRLNKKAARIKYKSAVNKSWPQFWKFLFEMSMGYIPKII